MKESSKGKEGKARLFIDFEWWRARWKHARSPAWSQFEIFSFHLRQRRLQGRRNILLSPPSTAFVSAWKWNKSKNLHSIYFSFIHPLDSMHVESHIWSKRAIVKENRTSHFFSSSLLSHADTNFSAFPFLPQIILRNEVSSLFHPEYKSPHVLNIKHTSFHCTLQSYMYIDWIDCWINNLKYLQAPEQRFLIIACRSRKKIPSLNFSPLHLVQIEKLNKVDVMAVCCSRMVGSLWIYCTAALGCLNLQLWWALGSYLESS